MVTMGRCQDRKGEIWRKYVNRTEEEGQRRCRLAHLTFHWDVFGIVLVCRPQTWQDAVFLYVPLWMECDTDYSHPQIHALICLIWIWEGKLSCIFFFAMQSALHDWAAAGLLEFSLFRIIHYRHLSESLWKNILSANAPQQWPQTKRPLILPCWGLTSQSDKCFPCQIPCGENFPSQNGSVDVGGTGSGWG